MTETRAIQAFTDRQLKQRIELNKAARFGLESATAAQLNVVFILCKRWQLDPVTDLTLYQGHPWITLEGHLRLLQRHPDYRGFEQRPLSKDEKLAWGYEADDLVVATTIRTAQWGDITQWGKVSRTEINEARDRAADERKRTAPVGMHPVEMAQKRSLARTQRAAFGMDSLPSDEDIEREMSDEMARRTDPVRVEANAAEYDRIMAPFTEDTQPLPQGHATLQEDRTDD